MTLNDKKYRIELSGKAIGYSFLEKADAPMGVVFGVIQFENAVSGYDLFLNYCSENGIAINVNYVELRLIDTQSIPALKVFSENGVEIKGLSTAVTGMDSEGFEIQILGIPSTLYEQEFSHHVKGYRNV